MTHFFKLLDDFIIDDICQFLNQSTLARLACVDKRLHHICQPYVEQNALSFVEPNQINYDRLGSESTTLPPTSARLTELIAAIHGMTKTHIFDMYQLIVSGYYKGKWFQLTNSYTNKVFNLTGQKGIQLLKLRRVLMDRINEAKPQSFSITRYDYLRGNRALTYVV